jgi:hypothetical protein
VGESVNCRRKTQLERERENENENENEKQCFSFECCYA